MRNLSLSLAEFSELSQIILTVVTSIGIVISMWLSIKALREVQSDRKLRQKPYLGFDIGGFRLPIEFVKAGKRIPGLEPTYVEKMFPKLPDDAESVRLKGTENEDGSIGPTFYGELRNYGLGPALSTEITWVPEKIWIGSEKFLISGKKLLEPPYHKDLNSMPTSPSHILPSKKATLSGLPTFIEKDFEKKVTKVEGFFEIECKDTFGEKHIVKQEFYVFTHYKLTKPYVHVTFGDLIEDVDAKI